MTITQEGEVGARDGTNKSPLCVSPTSSSPVRHSQTQFPSPQCHPQITRSSSSSSSSSGSRSSSESGSSPSGFFQSLRSGSGSHASSHVSSWACSDASDPLGSIHSCSASPEIVVFLNNDHGATAHGEEDTLHSDDKENLSQCFLSLPDISASDDKDTHKAIAHQTTWKRDIQYGTWQNEQICQDNNAFSQWNKTIHDYAEVGKASKVPNNIVPGTFKPLDTTANLLGLCQFYHTNPESAKSVPALKPPATTHKVKCLLEKARGKGQPYIIVMFEGGNVTPLGLLQELHSHYTLSHIPIFTAEEVKWGQKPHIFCCPIHAYVVKNDSVFLNHIMIRHYWCNFVCRKCLDIVAMSGQQMKKHFLKCCGISDACEKPDSQGSTSDGGQSGGKPSKTHHSGYSGPKDKKDKGDLCGNEEKSDKRHGLKESKTDDKAASQDDSQDSPHQSTCLAGLSATGGSQEDVDRVLCTHWSHKKVKKCGKSLHKKSHQ